MTAPAWVVMGVSGSGKSTVGRLLAERFGWRFLEGDDVHPRANIAKMRAGIPLDDRDRRPWLAAVARWIAAQGRAGEPCIVACSALKYAYRRILARGQPGLRFIYLKTARPMLIRRMRARRGHFMPVSLLDSQLRTLENPVHERGVLTVNGDLPPGRLLAKIIAAVTSAAVP